MSRKILLMVLLLVAETVYGADSLHSSWQKAGQFYRQKQYDSAAYYYEQIASLRPAVASVYYNLGNTYYRLNRVGLSVLNYERALKRAPNFKEAADNLLLAQSRIPNRIQSAPDIFFVRWWHALTRSDRAVAWSVLSLLLFLALIGLMLYPRVRRQAARPDQRLIAGLALCWLAALLLAWQSSRHTLHPAAGVVLREGAPLMKNPTPSEKPLSLLPEGTTVSLEQRRGTWQEISLPDGRSGWLQSGQLGVVD